MRSGIRPAGRIPPPAPGRRPADAQIHVSLDRVAEPDVSLTALALDVGFSSHSHFTDAFRKESGVSRFCNAAWWRKLKESCSKNTAVKP